MATKPYKTGDLTVIAIAIHDNAIPVIEQALAEAPIELLQALVDVGSSMQQYAQAEAARREVSLFTPWVTFGLMREEPS